MAYPYRYLRVDILSKTTDNTPKPHKLHIELDPEFEPKTFNFGYFTVEVYPFTWNAIQILFNKPIHNIKQLEDWITRWLDIADKNPENELELSGAVHSFTPIERYGEWWYLTADFGSAPNALIEFIELLASQGMSKIIIKGVEAVEV